MNKKIHSLEDIKAMYQAEKPKYIALKSPSGQYEVMFNSPKIDADVKFKEIERTLKKKSLPPGVYFYITKNSFAKTATEYSHPVGVGDYNLSDATVTAPPVMGEKTPSVWSPQEAVKHLSEINRLTLELDNANKKIAALQAENDELTAELEEAETLQENKTEAPPSWVDKLIEIGSPLLQKYFDQRDQELLLLSQKINQVKQSQRITPDDPAYIEYLDKIIQSQNADEIQSEMLYLKNNHNAFYLRLCELYKIDPNS